MPKIPKGTPEWSARATALGDLVIAEHVYLLATGWECRPDRSNVVQIRDRWPEGRMVVRWFHPVRAQEPVQEDEALRRQREADREEL